MIRIIGNTRRHAVAIVAAAALAGAGSALAFAAPVVATGAVWINGTGPDTVRATGHVSVLGSIHGPHPYAVIRTGASQALVDGTRRIGPRRAVDIHLASSAEFNIQAERGSIAVTLHGTAIAVDVAGTGTLTFTGRGTYLPEPRSPGDSPLKWPKGPLVLTTTSATAALRG